MRIVLKTAAALGLIAAAASANAAPIIGGINFAGYVQGVGGTGMATATGLDFVSGPLGTASPGVAGGLSSYGAGSGSFAGLACASITGSCGTIKDILSFTSFSPLSSFLTLNTATATISFDLSSITAITRTPDATGGSLTLSGQGVIHYSGLDDTAGSFSLTTQGNALTSFSATTMAGAVPEPATWAMMLVGFGAIGAAARSRRSTARVSFIG